VLWALVRHWRDKGCPGPTRTKKNYESWSQNIAAIIQCAGFESPCKEPAELRFSGDRDTRDMEALVEEMNPGRKYTFTELVQLAQDHELFEWMIGDGKEPLDNEARSKFGKFIKRRANRTFDVTDEFKVMHRARFRIEGDNRKKRRYVLQML
jgi:hypothetical protein